MENEPDPQRVKKLLREDYESKYPASTGPRIAFGFIAFIVCIVNLIGAKHSEGIPQMISFGCVALCAYISVKSFRQAWDRFDYNKKAEKFFNEEG